MAIAILLPPRKILDESHHDLPAKLSAWDYQVARPPNQTIPRPVIGPAVYQPRGGSRQHRESQFGSSEQSSSSRTPAIYSPSSSVRGRGDGGDTGSQRGSRDGGRGGDRGGYHGADGRRSSGPFARGSWLKLYPAELILPVIEQKSD